MPTPTPTAPQIQRVREIAALTAYEDAERLISPLNDEEWADALLLIVEWPKVKFKTTKLKGGRLGLETDPKQKRLLIRNEMRRILGLQPLTEEETDTGSGDAEAADYPYPISSLQWF